MNFNGKRQIWLNKEKHNVRITKKKKTSVKTCPPGQALDMPGHAWWYRHVGRDGATNRIEDGADRTLGLSSTGSVIRCLKLPCEIEL